MSERAAELALRFEQANDELIAAVRGYSEAQWQAFSEDEQRTVAAIAHHLGSAHAVIARWIKKLGAGLPSTSLTPERLHQANAEHAATYRACTQAEALELLERNGAAATATVRNLSDEELQRSAVVPLYGDKPMTAEYMAERILIGHLRGHFRSMQQAAGRAG